MTLFHLMWLLHQWLLFPLWHSHPLVRLLFPLWHSHPLVRL